VARRNPKTQPSAAAAPARPVAVDKTLTKGLQLLQALSEHEGSRGISELALELSLTKSNVHRLLQTLIKCGYVTREASTDRYLLSTKLWLVARRGRPFDALRRLARPVLRTLAEETDESVLFVVVENDEMVPIDQVETQNPVRVFFAVGQSYPIDRIIMKGKGPTALQLVALAARPQMEARAAVQKIRKELGRNDAFVDQQMALLADVRKDGFVFSRGEWVTGVNAVAVPVLDASQNLIGVMSCFGPVDRIPEGDLKRIQKILSRGAQELSRRICE
jgi:IclR family transcriptional regulator, KDG regulon repressor